MRMQWFEPHDIEELEVLDMQLFPLSDEDETTVDWVKPYGAEYITIDFVGESGEKFIPPMEGEDTEFIRELGRAILVMPIEAWPMVITAYRLKANGDTETNTITMSFENDEEE